MEKHQILPESLVICGKTSNLPEGFLWVNVVCFVVSYDDNGVAKRLNFKYSHVLDFLSQTCFSQDS